MDTLAKSIIMRHTNLARLSFVAILPRLLLVANRERSGKPLEKGKCFPFSFYVDAKMSENYVYKTIQ